MVTVKVGEIQFNDRKKEYTLTYARTAKTGQDEVYVLDDSDDEVVLYFNGKLTRYLVKDDLAVKLRKAHEKSKASAKKLFIQLFQLINVDKIMVNDLELVFGTPARKKSSWLGGPEYLELRKDKAEAKLQSKYVRKGTIDFYLQQQI